MRSGFNTHIAGDGVNWAFYEEEEMYKDYKCYNVRFPHDEEVDKRFDKLCGSVKRYYLEGNKNAL